MVEILIYFRCDGKWQKKDDGSYEWFSENEEIKSILLFNEALKVKFSEVVDSICERLCLSRSGIDLKISYTSLSTSSSIPKFILDDYDTTCYLIDRCPISQRRSVLHVELIKKDKCGEGNDEERHEDEENEECNEENDGINRDEYFDINIEKSDVHDAASAPGREGDRLERCTSKEHPRRETSASAPTPDQEFPHLDMVEVDHCEPLAVDDTCVSYTFDDSLGIAIGQEFESKMEVKNLLINASLKACFDYKIVRSTTKLFVAKCAVSDCKWSMRAVRINNSDRFSLRTYCNIHTCSSSAVDKQNRQATSDFVADVLRNEFPGQIDTPAPSKVMNIMKNHGVTISYFKAWKGKQIAANDVRGAPELSFSMLPSYLHMLKVINHGTVTHLVVDDDEKFKYLFIALGASIKGFKAMRKVIAVDGTFLKTKYKGTLLVATAQDGNYHQYPLAWAVVDSENDESWKWFLTKLEELVPDEEELVIISDRCQSIINAVAVVYKKSQHGFCAWHLSQNIKTRVNRGSRIRGSKKNGHGKGKDAVVTKFMNVAAAYTISEFNELYQDLSNRYPAAAEYLEDNVDVRKWARCYFTGCRYNIMTTNGAESINVVLRKARAYPLIPLMDAIIDKISEWFNRHRKESSMGSLSQRLTPRVERTLHLRKKESSFLVAKELNTTTLEYQVTGKDGSFLVDLLRKTCTCKVYDVDKFPCAHALAAYNNGTDNMHNLCSKYYLKELWALAYVETIYPVPRSSEWDIPQDIQLEKVLPPDFTKKRGPVQKTRFPSIGEHGRGKRKRLRQTTSSLASS